jgi:TRAP-type C4-dicarboxylate transport system permease small subunit
MTDPTASTVHYPARLEVDYPDQLNRVTTLFRLILCIPIVIVITVLSAEATQRTYERSGTTVTHTSGGIASGLFLATLLMIVFRQRYPRWWFDFSRELARFGARVGAYVALLTDTYPSTEDEQSVHLEIDYPDVKRDLNRWLPLVKWLLAIPHYIILVVLSVGAVFSVFIAWIAILFTGHYPRPLFDFVVGVGRWWLRVQAYAFLLVTDRYPPFSLS